MDNPYEVLNVDKTASEAHIKRVYRQLAQKHHPDRGGDKEIFQKIQWAYDLLSDPVRRKVYDETGHTEAKPPTLEEKVLAGLKATIRGLAACEGDLLGELVETLKGELKAARKQGRALTAARQRMERRLDGVIKFYGTGENFLLNAIKDASDHTLAQEKELHGVVECIELALKMLADYSTQEVPAPPRQSSHDDSLDALMMQVLGGRR